MTPQLANAIARHALQYSIDADESDIESYTLSQENLPESLWSEADEAFGPAQGEHMIYVIDVDDYLAATK